MDQRAKDRRLTANLLGLVFFGLVFLAGFPELRAEVIRLQPDGSLVIVGRGRTTAPTVLIPVETKGINLRPRGKLRPAAVQPQPLLSAQAGAPTPKVIRLGQPTAAPELDELIRKYAAQYGLDPKLVHLVVKTESGYNPQAVSPKGALGLMQLMPGTAALLGVRDPFDVEQNLAGGIRYLKMCLERFNNQLPLALAAYNAGPENVSRYGGLPPFAETLNYVRQIMAAYTGEALNLPVAPPVSAPPTFPQRVREKQPRLPMPFYLGSRARLTVTLAGGAKIIQIQRF